MTLLLANDPQPGSLVESFAAGEVALHLGYMSDSLGDNAYFLGDAIQAPDFGMAYIVALAERLGQLSPYANLQAYLERVRARPAFQRALERTGE